MASVVLVVRWLFAFVFIATAPHSRITCVSGLGTHTPSLINTAVFGVTVFGFIKKKKNIRQNKTKESQESD